MAMSKMPIAIAIHAFLFTPLMIFVVLFRLHAERGMRHGAEALLGDQLARDAVDAVRLVVNTQQGSLQSLDKLLLAHGHVDQFLLGL